MHPPARYRFLSPSSLTSLALFLAVGTILTCLPLRTSHDEWWHLKTGQWIAENGLPENDVFSYAAADLPWHNHEWLSEIAFWRVYQAGAAHGPGDGAGGIQALIYFKAVVVLFGFACLAVYLSGSTGLPALAWAMAALGIALSRRTLYPRPPVVTYALLAVLLCVFLAWRSGRLRSNRLLVLVPLFALWANLHGGFMAGLVVGGAFWSESLVDLGLARWRRERLGPPKARFFWATGIGVACFLATLATPYGIHLYALPARVMSDTRLAEIIGELRPPDMRFAWAVDGAMLLLLFPALRPRRSLGVCATFLAATSIFVLLRFGAESAVATAENPDPQWALRLTRDVAFYALILVVAVRSRARVGLGLTFCVLFFAYQGLEHVRHLPLLAVMLVPFLAESFTSWIRSSVERWDAMWTTKEVFATRHELRETILPRWNFRAQWAAVAGLLGLASFYALLPEEAAHLFQDEIPFRERLSARSLIDRNRLLFEGQDPSLDAWNEPGTEPKAYPKPAVDFLLREKPPGRLFNGANYSGYLIWRLSPEHYKTFSDNRYDIFGGQFDIQEKIVLTAFSGMPDPDPAEHAPSWEEVLEKWGINTLFIPIDSRLNRLLIERSGAEAPEWALLWSDDGVFAIWTRKIPVAIPQTSP